MGLTLTTLKHRARFRVELRWWWEAPAPGRPLAFRDAGEARAYLAAVCAPAEHAMALRSFALRDTPWLTPPPGDHEILGRLSTAIVAGRVRIAERAPDAFPSWDERREERLPTSPLFRELEPAGNSRSARPATAAAPEPPAPAEEVCWPCQRAAASARTLREASADASPFIANL